MNDTDYWNRGKGWRVDGRWGSGGVHRGLVRGVCGGALLLDG